MQRIREIAELLGLTEETTRAALRGQPGVPRATVEAVRDLAAELGSAAGAQSSRRDHNVGRAIGVVLPSVERWFYTTVLSGITGECAEAGYDPVLFDLSRLGPSIASAGLQAAIERSRVDALVVLSTDFSTREWEELFALGLPVMAVGALTPGVRRIGVDDYQISRAITERVIELGHRTIGYVGGHDPQALVETSVNDRERAFRDVLAEHDLPVRQEWVVSGQYQMGEAQRSVAELLRLPERPTALVCASDGMALGAMFSAAAAGLVIGQDLSITGIDGEPAAEAFGLTTIVQYPQEQGALATRTLIAECGGAPMRRGFIPARWSLVERSSLGPVPSDLHS